jgi:AraC family transcriptional regulator, transcriptional activator of pobA
VPRVPVHRLPAGPRVVVHRMDGTRSPLPDGDHAHDFFVLSQVEDEVVVVAPGDVVGPSSWGVTPEELRGVVGWSVLFDPEVLGAHTALAWRTHPLLAPFVGGRPPGVIRLAVRAGARTAFEERFARLDAELRERRDGYLAAATAHLTLLLVDVARLADGVLADLRLNREPLLGEVFAVIERRYAGPLSLSDVAAAVGLSPGHLTTRVRERTGRTVLEWITERRMLQARRLLATTDEPVAAVGRAVGVADPGYFARVFRREHGVSPAAWRAGSAPSG